MSRRRAIAGSMLLGGLLANPGVALADAAGPTDYHSEITSISTADGSPLPSGFAISVEGHDSFLLLATEPGVTAEVPGYEREPYLKFDADGSVFENRLSFSRIYNRDRYGSVERPNYIDNLAEPEWVRVDDDGSYAWHDHRIHYMNTRPPIGAKPGDVIIDMAVPIRVNGVPVEIGVQSTLLSPNQPLIPLAIAMVIALGIAIVTARPRTRGVERHVLVITVISLTLGFAWYLELPKDTGPALTWVLLPATALIASAIALIAARGDRRFTSNGASLVAMVQIALWVIDRFGVFDAALLPTSLPQWIDRALTASVVGAVLPLTYGSTVGLIRASR